MTVNESAGTNPDLSVGVPADSNNRVKEDETYQKKNSDSTYDAKSKEDTPFLSSVDVTKIGILPEKFKSSKSSLVLDVQFSEDKRKESSRERAEGTADTEHLPPDGGFRAWMIMLGSFMINGILFSVINTYSLIYVELQKRLEETGETEASTKAALVGSLTIGTTFFLSPIAGILTDKFGIQLTTFLGGAFAFGGMLLASFFSHQVEVLYLTYGVMYGFGASLAYTPSLVILGHYFKRYLGLVNGIVTAGSSVFTIIMPYLIEPLLKNFGLVGTLRSLAALTSVVMGCAVLFKPVTMVKVAGAPTNERLEVDCCSRLKEVVNVSIWKKKKYVVWASAIPLALFGYFVPYVHIGKFVSITFKDADKKLPVMCIGITSGIGRLVFGYIADLPRVNRILLQQISFVSIGVLTMLLPVTPSFGVLLLIALCMGLFDGCFISLLGPIAFDICGHKGATQAIGFLLGMCSVPLTVGPPIAGRLFDRTGSYKIPFILAGVPPIIGALAMFLVRCVKEQNSDDDKKTEDQHLQNGNFATLEIRGSTMMENREPSSEEGRSRKETVRCRLLELPRSYSTRTCRQSYSPYSDTSPYPGYATDYSKDHRDPEYSESVPLLLGRKSKQGFTRMETFDRPPRNSILLTC